MPWSQARERSEIAAGDVAPAIAALVERSGEGRIRVVRNGVARFVWFAGGKVRAVTSSADAEKLGGWLIARGIADRRAVDDALARKAVQERLGAWLVRQGVILPPRLADELASLSYVIASRVLAEGGSLVGEPGVRLPSDAKTVESDARALFVDAVRGTPDLDPLVRLVGHGRAWEAAARWEQLDIALSESQRYLLALLRPAKTLDGLRRVVLQDYAEVVRDLATLVAAGAAVPRLSSPAASVLAARPETAVERSGEVRDLPPGGRGAALPRPAGVPSRVRVALDGVERTLGSAEAMRRGLVGGDGVLSGAALRRAEALLATARRQLEAGDARAALRTLTYGAETVPCAALHTSLAEVAMRDVRTAQLALSHLKRAIEENPSYAPAWLALARFWAERGQHAKHRRCLEKAQAIDPEAGSAGEAAREPG